ncbi:MAG: hypothetical protein Harvfovirus3_78 [Harvfovirus sp.]|uniref:Uncharacterized protein n=1 Tax=Harvfovirus sp. TaxID=2487768 RepID=A0A3G5A485_9VIRU|nr:MAG: hypothetical protein Harvfovirus3_78 [Harvfovirus sp.]
MNERMSDKSYTWLNLARSYISCGRLRLVVENYLRAVECGNVDAMHELALFCMWRDKYLKGVDYIAMGVGANCKRTQKLVAGYYKDIGDLKTAQMWISGEIKTVTKEELIAVIEKRKNVEQIKNSPPCGTEIIMSYGEENERVLFKWGLKLMKKGVRDLSKVKIPSEIKKILDMGKEIYERDPELDTPPVGW